MLQFDELSYWEKTALTEGIDYAIVGGGIVGIATALHLREIYPNAKIVILERGYVSTGASTKNAGFACFGSVTELADDLKKMDETSVWNTVEMRWRGLQRLHERFPDSVIDLQLKGSWDLIASDETKTVPELSDQMQYFNAEIERITGFSSCFSYDTTIAEKAGFNGINGGFHNKLEGEIHTGKLLAASNLLLAKAGIICLFGVEVKTIQPGENEVLIETNYGELKSGKLAVTVNGFAQKLLNDQRIQPARAQVIVSSKMPGFELPGTFHYQQGYYYFRSIDNRLLLGGGRNLDFSGETTTEFENTSLIINTLEALMHNVILPGKDVTIDYKWSGIMGVGTEKKPLIEFIHPNVGIGVRMGGMGVAIGSLVGEELAELLK
ncbi:MAG: FAD-binding oxidoreductase [Fluviicola sp.]|nr:FAD-binding oxidoreductase [Fluviicola sp.]